MYIQIRICALYSSLPNQKKLKKKRQRKLFLMYLRIREIQNRINCISNVLWRISDKTYISPQMNIRFQAITPANIKDGTIIYALMQQAKPFYQTFILYLLNNIHRTLNEPFTKNCFFPLHIRTTTSNKIKKKLFDEASTLPNTHNMNLTPL